MYITVLYFKMQFIPVFSAFRYNSNMLIFFSRNMYYYCYQCRKHSVQTIKDY